MDYKKDIELLKAELSRRTKVSRPTIYKALRGYDVRNDSWAKLSKYFNCKISDLRMEEYTR